MRLLALLLTVGLCVTTQATPDVRINTLASGLDEPWSVAILPNDDLLVTFRPGTLRRLSKDGVLGPVINGSPDTLYFGQGGYFDVVLDPDFEANQTIYLSFASGTKDANATRVVRATLQDNELLNVTPIFTTNVSKDTGAHYGGRLAFLSDGTLLITTGDGFEYRAAAQDVNSQLGKVIRITPDGGFPSDNPFAEQTGGAQAVYSLGHRNPQGLAIDPHSNSIYLHEHGPRGGDEINKLEGGNNYGWPVTTYGINYSGALVSPFKTLPHVTDPIQVWDSTVAPSGLAVVQGNEFPDWQGDLLVGSLVRQQVLHINIENGRVVSEQAVFPSISARIRDVRVGKQGAIYVVTDGPDARIYKITRGELSSTINE